MDWTLFIYHPFASDLWNTSLNRKANKCMGEVKQMDFKWWPHLFQIQQYKSILHTDSRNSTALIIIASALFLEILGIPHFYILTNRWRIIQTSVRKNMKLCSVFRGIIGYQNCFPHESLFHNYMKKSRKNSLQAHVVCSIDH